MDEETPLQRLLIAHAGRDRQKHRLLWAYDRRLADIVRTTREPMIGQMRLTWWHDVITDPQRAKGRGDPLVDALRADMPQMVGGEDDGAALIAMIDGWEALLEPMPLDEDMLAAYAQGRGGGLFRAMAGEEGRMTGGLPDAGAIWALWDLAAHISDDPTAMRAVGLAQAREAALPPMRWPRTLAPLRIATKLAAIDIRRGQRAPAEMTPRLHARFLRIALFGRS
ncbi:squalene/phytoene synthase family protein [Sphingobium aquiterrae]|uniref:squalene/phytoene synthase family protein n=1 Tax=Sphingobium aquiterrae TaxID=2038656 RepID=UPI003017E983